MIVEGALSAEAVAETLGEGAERLAEQLNVLPEATGTLVVRITVAKEGFVKDVEFLTDTVVARPWDVRENDTTTARARIQVAVHSYFSEYTFEESRGTTTITLPIVFN